jgi:hypothetical protein
LILGLTLTAWRRTYSWFVPAVLVVIPYLAYVTAPFIVPRNMDAALPFATLLEAAAVVEAYRILMRWERNKGRTGRIHEKANGAQPESRREVDRIGYGSAFAGLAMLALVLLRSVFPAWRAWEIGNELSGYATAARFALRHDGGKALTGTEVVVFYLRGNGLECTAPRLPFWRPRLDAAIRDGFDYAILDRTVASSLDGYVRRHAHLVARYSALGDVRTGENLIASENTYPPNVYQPPDIVSVYDLRQLPLGPRRSPPVSVSCDRDYPA